MPTQNLHGVCCTAVGAYGPASADAASFPPIPAAFCKTACEVEGCYALTKLRSLHLLLCPVVTS